jgi:hypothetical protein
MRWLERDFARIYSSAHWSASYRASFTWLANRTD